MNNILYFKEDSFIKNFGQEIELNKTEFVMNFTNIAIGCDLNKYLKFGIWEFVLGSRVNKNFSSTGVFEVLEKNLLRYRIW